MRRKVLSIIMILMLAFTVAMPVYAIDDYDEFDEYDTYDEYDDGGDYDYDYDDGDYDEDEDEICDHEWDDWEVTKVATIFRTGTKVRTCIYCDETQTKTIKKLNPFVKFAKKTYKITKGKSLALKAKFAKGDKVKKWKSSNKKVATVSKNGKITSKKTGKTKITVIMKSGKKASCTINVTKPKKKSGKRKKSGSTVYWTPSGSVYHLSSDCSALSRSKTVYSGSISESGKSRACKVCGN